ncbi:L-lysine 6-monooxygenase (NADPH-requiring)-domain-containing protein [Cladochytrium replicatum]|nr:L-lysine 6-monooxygenase (NADPH-requiring)-domain-containing protein [Cladochytrium replicatum]
MGRKLGNPLKEFYSLFKNPSSTSHNIGHVTSDTESRSSTSSNATIGDNGSQSPLYCDIARVNEGEVIVDDVQYDTLCVGFGPSSLSIAVAMSDFVKKERGSTATLDDPSNCDPLFGSNLKLCFIEKQAGFTWHGGMLLEDARMQISFLKDLATIRDPTSHFTFLNYLNRQGRMLQFLNLGTFYPLRKEYNNYMKWVASHFNQYCQFGEQVVKIVPVVSDSGLTDMVSVLSVRLEDGAIITRTARNVIVGIGGQARLPNWAKDLVDNYYANLQPQVRSSVRFSVSPPPTSQPYTFPIFHTSQYMNVVGTVLPASDAPHKIAVVGGGQSGAEVFCDLVSRYPNAHVSLVFRDEALRPADESPFVNSTVFNPTEVDRFYGQPSAWRSSMLHRNRNTNYAVVNNDLIEHIFSNQYKQSLKQSIEGAAIRERILASTEVVSGSIIGETTKRVSLILSNSHAGAADASTWSEVFDVVVFATGYQRVAHRGILEPLLPYFVACKDCENTERETYPVHTFGKFDSSSAAAFRQSEQRSLGVMIGRDYRLVSKTQDESNEPLLNAGVYLQGCCEETHGFGDTLLSNLAVRGSEVLQSLLHKDQTISSKAHFSS